MKGSGGDWKETKLGDILRYLDERVVLDDEKEYLTITVRRRHGGLEAREKLFGHQIATKKQFRLVPGAFIISRVQCWHQAYAIVGNVPSNMIASSNYDQFAISREVDPQFFWWLSHSPAFTETVRSSAVGVVIEKMVFNRAAWLTKTVTLPRLAEQRRVVARIEEMAAQIQEAHNLRHEAANEAAALWARSASDILDRSTEQSGTRQIADLVTIRGGGTPSKSDPFYWEGKIPWITPKDMKRRELSDAIDHISERATQETAAKLIEPGAVLVVVRGMILAHTFPSALLRVPAAINQDIKALVPNGEILPQFLCGIFWAHNERMLSLVEKSTHDTRKLETLKLLGTKIPVPSLSEQRRILADLDALQAQVDALKRLQAETTTELDALLPSILDRAFKGEL